MRAPRSSASVPWLPSYLVLAVVWGSSFAFVDVALRALSPVQVVAARLVLGMLTLLTLCLITRTPLPASPRTWGHLAVVGLLLNAAPFILFAVGQQHVPSLLAGILNAATPLLTVLVVLATLPDERPTVRQLVGIAVGFMGILVVLAVWQGVPRAELGAVLACLAAVSCYAVALPYARRTLQHAADGPTALAAAQLVCASVWVVPALLVGGFHTRGPITGDVIAAVLAVGVLGSGVAYVLNYQVLQRAGATVASSVTYLTPVVAVLVGVGVLGERLAWYHLVGGSVVFAAVALTRTEPRKTDDEADSAPAGGQLR